MLLMKVILALPLEILRLVSGKADTLHRTRSIEIRSMDSKKIHTGTASPKG